MAHRMLIFALLALLCYCRYTYDFNDSSQFGDPESFLQELDQGRGATDDPRHCDSECIVRVARAFYHLGRMNSTHTDCSNEDTSESEGNTHLRSACGWWKVLLVLGHNEEG